jgi:hypothetical protein
MYLHSRDAYEELLSNLLIGVALRDKLSNFDFAVGELALRSTQMTADVQAEDFRETKIV